MGNTTALQAQVSAVGSFSFSMTISVFSFFIFSVHYASASPSPHLGFYRPQYQWPSSLVVDPIGRPVAQSTCFGCRGKRSASPQPHGAVAGPRLGGLGVAVHPGRAAPFGGTSFVGPTVWGLPSRHRHFIGKREAEPHLGLGLYPGYGYGYAWPGGYTQVNRALPLRHPFLGK